MEKLYNIRKKLLQYLVANTEISDCMSTIEDLLSRKNKLIDLNEDDIIKDNENYIFRLSEKITKMIIESYKSENHMNNDKYDVEFSGAQMYFLRLSILNYAKA